MRSRRWTRARSVALIAPLAVLALVAAACNDDGGGGSSARNGSSKGGTGRLGAAKVKLVGLPPKVTAPEVEITAETKEFDLPLTVEATATAGQYRNLFCQVTVTVNGEAATHSAGSSELRIDVPIAPKVAAAPAAPAVPQPAKPAEKRLSRLEQLRQEQADREKSAKEKKDWLMGLIRCRSVAARATAG